MEQQIIDLYQRGESIFSIYKQLHISKYTILKILKKHNISITDKYNRRFDISSICIDYTDHQTSIEDIAANYNTTIDTIKKILLNNNIIVRRRQHKPIKNIYQPEYI